jgi:hypothetical protein
MIRPALQASSFLRFNKSAAPEGGASVFAVRPG